MRSFKHSGDAGDVIYSLPVVRLLGGGDFYLSTADFTRVRMDESAVRNIGPLLAPQPYIRSVQLHSAEPVTHDLDAFRGAGEHQDNIAARHCWAFSLSDDVINEPWLTVEPVFVKPVIINRTARFQNPLFPWQAVVDKYRDRAAFVGTLAEYWDFTAQFGYLPRYKTANLLEVAQVIAGADLFIGNQSCPCAIAEGLKKPLVQESWPEMPNCIFQRQRAQHVLDGTVIL